MDHAVHYRTSGGETTFEEAGSLEAAVAMVERLRNDEGVSDVRVYKQIPIEFKAYYKVSVVDGSGPAAAPSAAAPAAAPAPDATPPAAPSTPPPGAMPLGQSQPISSPAPAAAASEAPEDETRRGSLFSRG